MNFRTTRLAALMGSASFLSLTFPAGTQAQTTAAAPVTQAAAEPEQVLVTGPLIHGAAAVGVPVTKLGV